MSCKASIVLFLLNFFGILNARRIGDRLKFSLVSALVNAIKMFLLVYFRAELYKFFSSNSKTPYQQNLKFSTVFHVLRYIRRMLITALPMLLQLIQSRRNISLVNAMLDYKVKLVKAHRPLQKVFARHENFCIKRLSILWILVMLALICDFFFTLQLNFMAFISYLIFLFPFLIILIFGSYIFCLFEFLACCQRALSSFLLDTSKQNEHVAVIQIIFLRKELISLKKLLLKTVRFTVFETIFASFILFVNMVNIKIDLDGNLDMVGC